jgi:putative hydrolase of the HAD superfamily
MIAVVGQSVIDRIKLPGHPWIERLGGAPIFAAEALAATGIPAVILTRGATPTLRRPLHALGIEVIEGPGTLSCVSEMAFCPDGSWSDAFCSFGEPFTPDDVNGWMAPGLSGAHAIVCGTQWCEDFSDETLAALAKGGRPLYLDGQGPLRAAQLGPLRLEGPLRRPCLRHVAVLKLAEEEARVALGGIDPAAAARLGVPLVVVTVGERGAVVLSEGRSIEIGVEPVRGLADTVGAGDAFLALMAAGGRGGTDPIEAVRFACRETANLLRRRLTSPAGIEATTETPSRGSRRGATPPAAVLFDFGGTLDADGETWKARSFRLFREAGVATTPAVFDRAFHAADDALTGAVPPALSLHDTVHRLFQGTAARLGLPEAEELAARLASRFLAASAARFRANAPLLRRLADVYPLAIVSNFYGNLATVCGDAGIGRYFATIVDSARVGCRKPEAAIFHHALRDLGVPPARALFVGDSRPRDMAGARAIDMPHVWLAPSGTAGEGPCCPDDTIIHSLGELEGLLL